MSGTYPFVLLLAAAALSAPFSRAADAPAARVAFPGSIKEVPASTAATAAPGPRRAAAISRLALRADEQSAGMNFEVALRLRHFDELQARVARGEQISRVEMAARYFPLPADHDKVVQWLRAQGLEITRTDDNRIAVFGRGSVDAVARAFQVDFARVTGADGIEYTSAVTAPSLPADVAPTVLGIHGLQPHIRRRALSIPRAPDKPTSNSQQYLPSQIATAYNANGLSVNGAGQTIALYELAVPATSDLTSFWAAAGISTSLVNNIQTVNVAGGPTAPSSGSVEESTLDVEWASAMAPGATIRIYAANENDPADNDEILQQVYADLPGQPSLHQLCICIGGNELEVEQDYLVIEAQYMASLASAGVSVFVASGDSGAYNDNVLQTTYPTSDPDVTGVGGTSLTLSNTNAVTSETAWSGSGGGVSAVFVRPSWQTGTGVPAGTMRLVPDVAAAADPNLGAMVFYNGVRTQVGGTSWATPVWAAFCALLNQGRSTPLGLLNPKLYPLIGSSTNSLRDITSGNNGYYSAGTGYDLCTGVGVPNVANLLKDTFNTNLATSVPATLGNQVVTVGQPAIFFAVGAGTPPLTYQWLRQAAGSPGFVALSDNGTYSGSATSTLFVNGTTLAMTGDEFQCVVTGASGSVTTSPSGLTVNVTGVTTKAGWPGSAGSANGTGWAARFAYPGSVRTDASGNVFVADSYNNTIREVTPGGVVTTVAGTPGVAGSKDGPVATALFDGPAGVAVDAGGNIFVADDSNYTIREISAAGTVSTLAGSAGSQGEVDGTGSAARFYDPQNLAIDAAGNLYVADGLGNSIRKVTPAGVVTTIAGSSVGGSADGTGAQAGFRDPTGIAVDASGNVYVADNGNNTIRLITPAGVVTTIAGSSRRSGSADGTGTAATFDGPAGVGVDNWGNVYVADALNCTIRKIAPGNVVTTIAGSAGVAENIDGLPANARFYTPGDVTVDGSGVLYVADTGNETIRRLIPGSVATAPTITTQPAGQSVNAGASVTFATAIAGTPPFSFQWYFNGNTIAGATGSSLVLANVQQAQGGTYTLSVANAEGSVTSSAATLTVAAPSGFPDITVQPQGGTLASGGSVVLSVTATGTGPFTYQWFLNGTAIPGATASTYTVTTAGSYTVAVTNATGTATSSAAVVSLSSRLVNISGRALVGTGANIAIAGFVIDGPAGSSKQMLIRGVGPQLAALGVGSVLAQPTIALFNSSGTVIASNTGWGTNANAAQIATVAAQVGAFALPAGSADSALLVNLAPGVYLVELYEVNPSDAATLGNISTRAQVGTGGNILFAGFVITGTQPATVLVRGVGPVLGTLGVANYLAQPILNVFNSSGTAIATNVGWSTNANAAQIATVSTQVGAYPLPAGSADSALLLTLPPGAYTTEIAGANGTIGVALAEVYFVPP